MQAEERIDNNQFSLLFERFTQEIDDRKAGEESENLKRANCSVLGRQYLDDLREQINSKAFTSDDDEIIFFKTIKPLFSTQLIYFSETYNLELRLPQGSKQRQEDFLMDEYDRLSLFAGLHYEFFQYYRSGRTDMDHLYFLRAHNNSLQHALLYTEIDPSFSTGYDQLVARFRANDMIGDYITRKISELHDHPASESKLQSQFTWTSPVAALVELIVALDAHAVFNNSSVGIGRLAPFFASMFGVKMNNIHKTYEEIRLRKKNRTAFLDALKMSMLRKMEHDDEHAR